MTQAATAIYDSAQRHAPIVTELRNLWDYRGLVRLLVARDLTVRYKRSVLGVWWTLLNPLLTTAVLWVIFSQVFQRASGADVPFIVYLLSGILLTAYFSQGLIAAGSAILGGRSVLVKMYVPAETFSFSAAVAAAINFLISLLILCVVQLTTGVGIPWTVLLVPIPTLALLALVTGLGLMVAAAAVHFYDVLDLTKVLAQLISFAVPTFYPLEIIPERFVVLIKLNPLYSYLVIFRGFMYEGVFAPWWNFAVMGVTAVVALVLGVWVFSRSWKNVVAAL